MRSPSCEATGAPRPLHAASQTSVPKIDPDTTYLPLFEYYREV